MPTEKSNPAYCPQCGKKCRGGKGFFGHIKIHPELAHLSPRNCSVLDFASKRFSSSLEALPASKKKTEVRKTHMCPHCPSGPYVDEEALQAHIGRAHSGAWMDGELPKKKRPYGKKNNVEVSEQITAPPQHCVGLKHCPNCGHNLERANLIEQVSKGLTNQQFAQVLRVIGRIAHLE